MDFRLSVTRLKPGENETKHLSSNLRLNSRTCMKGLNMNWVDEGALYSSIGAFLREDLGRGDITSQAIIEYEEALRIDPNLTEAAENLRTARASDSRFGSRPRK